MRASFWPQYSRLRALLTIYAVSCCMVHRALAEPTLSAHAPIDLNAADQTFHEAQQICMADHGKLWGVSLCGPIMFVDPQSRFLVANQPDAHGVLQQQGEVFTGLLPSAELMANTAVYWSGVYWTQMLWPLPANSAWRDTLIAHELFHRIQGQLQLPELKAGDNRQLDTLQGRYLLQLEWRALGRALTVSSASAIKTAAADAVLFRAQRYNLFPGAAASEQALEYNEGLAEFTGVKLGNVGQAAQLDAALGDLSVHVSDDTFVRSFPYATGPAYGLLLDRFMPDWQKRLTGGPRLDVLLQEALALTTPANLQEAVTARAQEYGGPTLFAAETVREEARQRRLAAYRTKFVDGAVLVLPLTHMRIQFDPRNLQPFEDRGTVYPNLNITDDWGTLEVQNGALLRPDWRVVTVSAPQENTGRLVRGDGWTLHLNPGWKLIPGARHGDFTLSSASQ
jgi:hypothetical protein